METKINISVGICFAVFTVGLLSVGADLLSAMLAALLFAPLLVAFFTGPALVIAAVLCCFKVTAPPAETLQDCNRRD